MSLKTFTTTFTANQLPGIPVRNSDGMGFTLTDPGTYTLSAPFPWAHDSLDEVALADMSDQIDAGETEEFVVTAGSPVTKYVKADVGSGFEHIRVSYDIPDPVTADDVATTTDANGNLAIGASALAALTSGTNNTALGKNAGDEVTSGSGNAFVGYKAGHDLGATIANTCGFGLGNSQGIYFDVDQGGNVVNVTVRYTNGAIKTATIPLS